MKGYLIAKARGKLGWRIAETETGERRIEKQRKSREEVEVQRSYRLCRCTEDLNMISCMHALIIQIELQKLRQRLLKYHAVVFCEALRRWSYNVAVNSLEA